MRCFNTKIESFLGDLKHFTKCSPLVATHGSPSGRHFPSGRHRPLENMLLPTDLSTNLLQKSKKL